MLNFVSTRASGSASAKLLSSWVAPSVYWRLGLFFLRCKTFHFPLLSCIRFLMTHFSYPSRSLWMAM